MLYLKKFLIKGKKKKPKCERLEVDDGAEMKLKSIETEEVSKGGR